MILFLIKKTFFDMWDNLLSIALVNLGIVLLIGGLLSLLQFTGGSPAILMFVVLLALLMLSLYLGITSQIANHIADYQSPEFKQILQYLKQGWKASLLFAGIVIIQFAILFIVLPWYWGRGNIVGIAVTGLLFWGSLIWLFASQYYFPVSTRLNAKIKDIPMKCLLLFFDNTVFTIFLGFGTLVLAILSTFTAFLFPGVATIVLWHQAATKLRLYKYDYLEDHPNSNRRRIPWDELLVEDRDRVGTRTLRGMIFPWKG